MLHNLEHLIPKQILDLCHDDRFDLELTLTGFAAENRWPWVEIFVDNNLLVSGAVENTQTWKCSYTVTNFIKPLNVKIQYSGKTDTDTVVNNEGDILENQGVILDRLLINDIDIIKNSTIYNFGRCAIHLSDQKKKLFKEIGIESDFTHSLKMFENSSWELSFAVPVLSDLASKKSFYFSHEVINRDLYAEIYQRILRIQSLESQLKDKQ